MPTRFYLDYNATTPLHPQAAAAMRPFLEDHFGNPSSIHSFGRTARVAVDEARRRIAGLIGAKPGEIVFTSGGTESNNLAVFGTACALRHKGRHLAICATEHHAVLQPCRRLESEGFEITRLPVDSLGLLDLNQLAAALRPDTILVSLMSANNETGVRHPVREIGALCRKQGVIFHCDAVQSFGKERVHVEEWNVDMLSLAAHKFYGPKGVGALYIRSGLRIQPLHLGGSHENERRAGTENVAAIAGMAVAAGLAAESAERENRRLYDLTENLWQSLSAAIPGTHRNGHSLQRTGNTLNVSFDGCDAEGLLLGLDLEGVAVSNGAACMVGSVQPSHVLHAMGIPQDRTRAAVRFSLGNQSAETDLPEIVRRVAHVVGRLRSLSGT